MSPATLAPLPASRAVTAGAPTGLELGETGRHGADKEEAAVAFTRRLRRHLGIKEK